MARRGAGREKYREMSVAEFFAKNKELAGFSNPTRALYQAVRELVENALDATDAYYATDAHSNRHAGPEIRVRIESLGGGGNGGELRDRYRVTVEDNGIGVPPTVIADAFGRVLFSSKYIIRQTRGMYGLGVKATILYGQMTTGLPVEVITSTPGSSYVYMKKLYIDMNKNAPRVVEEAQWRKKGSWHGTIVSVALEGDWRRARSRILEYVRRTAVIAPYADIIFETPEGELHYFPRITGKMPPPPREAKPHPHGIDAEQLKAIISSTKHQTLLDMLVNEFQSTGEKSVRELLGKLGLDPGMNPRRLLRRDGREALMMLVDALRTYPFRAPRSDYLSPLGEEIIKIGLLSMYSPEWVSAVTRTPRAHQGHPFIVEVGIAYGGSVPLRDEGPLLLRYANKIPLIYEEREDAIYKVVNGINWRLYNVEFPAPMVVLVHIASTKVPYKGVGKESISEVPELESEIRNAVLEVARKLKGYMGRKRREAEARRKVVTLAKYIPDIARSLAVLSKPSNSWRPPERSDEEPILEALIRLVARSIAPVDGGDSRAEQVVRSIIGEVKVE